MPYIELDQTMKICYSCGAKLNGRTVVRAGHEYCSDQCEKNFELERLKALSILRSTIDQLAREQSKIAS